MAKKDLVDKVAQQEADKRAYNPLMASLRENDKRHLFNTTASSFFHKTGFPLFDYYFGSVANIHNEVGEIVKQEPRVGQAAGTFNMVVGNTGTGKALPDDTLIPTPTGPVRMGDLRVGDLVFGPDGQPTEVIGVFPQGLKQIWEVRCENDRTIQCSPDHLWQYTYQVGDRTITRLDTTEKMGVDVMACRHRRSVNLPAMKPIEIEETHLEIDPYLTGLFVVNPRYHRALEYLIAHEDAKLKEVADQFKIKQCELKWLLGDAFALADHDQIRDTLEKIANSTSNDRDLEGERWLPLNVMWNSPRYRWRALRGIIDGAGRISYYFTRYVRSVVVSLWSQDRGLLEMIRKLARSLGLDGAITEPKQGPTRYKLKFIGHLGHELVKPNFPHSKFTEAVNLVNIENEDSARYHREDRSVRPKVITVGPKEGAWTEMTCIKVARQDGLFVTEDFVVTHNTTLVVQMAANIIRGYEKGLVMHYDFEQRFDISRAENLTRLPIHEFDDGGRYVLQQGEMSLEDAQEAIVKLYAAKIQNRDELLVKTGKLDEFGKEIEILPPTVVIFDSVSNIIPDGFSVNNAKDLADAEKLRGNMAGARDAKTIRGFLRDISPLLKGGNIIIYAINHINSNVQISMFSGPQKQMNFLKPDESIPGGKALFYNSYNLPKLISKPSDDFTEATDGFNGHMVMIEPVKSSSNQSGNNNKGVSFDMVFSYKSGFDSLRSLILYAKEKGIIEGTKPRLKFVGDPSFTFAWKNLDTEKNEKPIWDCIKKFVIPELETHLSFVEPLAFDDRSMDY